MNAHRYSTDDTEVSEKSEGQRADVLEGQRAADAEEQSVGESEWKSDFISRLLNKPVVFDISIYPQRKLFMNRFAREDQIGLSVFTCSGQGKIIVFKCKKGEKVAIVQGACSSENYIYSIARAIVQRAKQPMQSATSGQPVHVTDPVNDVKRRDFSSPMNDRTTNSIRFTSDGAERQRGDVLTSTNVPIVFDIHTQKDGGAILSYEGNLIANSQVNREYNYTFRICTGYGHEENIAIELEKGESVAIIYGTCDFEEPILKFIGFISKYNPFVFQHATSILTKEPFTLYQLRIRDSRRILSALIACMLRQYSTERSDSDSPMNGKTYDDL